VSKHWPFIHPGTVLELEVEWWAYYVRAAQQIDAAARDARDEVEKLQQRGKGRK